MTLRVVLDSIPDDPALDTAVARALLERVASGELPETLRLARPGPIRRGMRWVPPQPGKMPSVTSGSPI